MMRDALLRDLADIPGLSVSLTHDARLPAPDTTASVTVIDTRQDVSTLWQAAMQAADMSWIIAPETNGILTSLNRLALQHGQLVGCDPSVVDLMTDKFATFGALRAAGIATVPTYWPDRWPSTEPGAWVLKPVDGAGCEDVRHFPTAAALQAWLGRHASPRHVVQPYLPGEAASLSMVCRDGQARLLSCNRQHVHIDAGHFHYAGSEVNALAHHWDRFERLAQQLASAFPGLRGYIGVDVLVTDEVVYVVEINPRLTTSYVGLRESIGCNPARLILDFLYNESFEEAGSNMPEPLSRQVIEVTP